MSSTLKQPTAGGSLESEVKHLAKSGTPKEHVIAFINNQLTANMGASRSDIKRSLLTAMKRGFKKAN